jgi:beta-lactamase regulating signal transducer with metallopeptidase domain
MIAAWLVYSLVVATMLYVGARALELAAQAINIPTRFIWVAAIAGAVALSTRQLVRVGNGQDVPTPSLERRIARRVRAAAPVAMVERRLDSAAPQQPIRQAMRTVVVNAIYKLARTRGAIHRVDVAPFDRWNKPLLAGWFVGSAAVAGILFVAFGRLRALEAEFEQHGVDGVSVAVSRDVGPALFGIGHPRIVVPAWVLDLPATERRIILAHEREHALARDPQTLLGALLFLIVQPWNVALWAMLSRLRLAIEMDCDRRVLGTTADARRYGELLVLVHSRRALAPQPLLSFVQRHSTLERRIRRIASRGPSRPAVLGSLLRAGIALGIAAWTPGPTPTHRAEARPSVYEARPLDIAFQPIRRSTP